MSKRPAVGDVAVAAKRVDVAVGAGAPAEGLPVSAESAVALAPASAADIDILSITADEKTAWKKLKWVWCRDCGRRIHLQDRMGTQESGCA